MVPRRRWHGSPGGLAGRSRGGSSSSSSSWHLPGTMWLLGVSWVAQLVAAASGLVDQEQLCPKPAVSPNTILVQPGMNVTLPCLEGELENITQVHWMFNGRNLSASTGRQVIPGPSLFLPSVYFSDSGRYACYTDSRRLLCSLRLMVEEPPEAPNFTCFRKSLAKDIFCEWKTSRGMSTHTKARMWVQKNFVGVNRVEQPCRYYTKSRKFSCRIEGIADDVHILKVSVCIFNLAGALSSHSFISTENLLKPDPPVDVEVRNVELHPCKLFVTWRKPPSWGSSFFRLQFEIRYRVEASAAYNKIHLQDEYTTYTISDVMPGVRHVVQVRAREEFNQGIWSEWSRESFGVPWTETKDRDPETTLVPSEVDPFASTVKPPKCTSELPVVMSKPTVENAASTPLYLFLIMAVSVTGIVGILVVGVILRYGKKWGTSPCGEEKPSTAPPRSLTLMAPEPPLSSSPLLSPPASPFSESSVDTPSIPENSPYDVSNADYFLMP
uniref:interleukin-6 receptor subunit alpha n=1 Tax=Podarcis muralis TaxID=64176 RepID=UPI00109F3749|nr:interleukin-6 receptor subunit alpha [Podarcis muralis]